MYSVYDDIQKVEIAQTSTLDNAEIILREWTHNNLHRWNNVKIGPCEESANKRYYLITEVGKPMSRLIIKED